MPLSAETLKAIKYLKDREIPFNSTEWTTREKLALSSAVLENGQEYWPTISRVIQPFASEHRTDKSWCSAKECAKQYLKLCESTETKKRNENNKSFIPIRELIVKNLTAERIEELQEDIRYESDRITVWKNTLIALDEGALDDNLEEIWRQLKQNPDFIEYEAEMEKGNHQSKAESETTDAMTSSCMEDEFNSDDDLKPRIILHLKKALKKISDSDDETDVKNEKLESPNLQDSEDSGDTEPAICDSDIKVLEDALESEEHHLEQQSYTDNVVKAQEQNISTLSNLAWVKISKSLIQMILDDPNSHLFDTSLLMKHDSQYNSIIKKILNAVEIRNNLKIDFYSSPYDFEHDLMLILCNAIAYYPIGSPSNKIARNIYERITPLLQCLYESDNVNTSFTEVGFRRSTRKSITHNINNT